MKHKYVVLISALVGFILFLSIMLKTGIDIILESFIQAKGFWLFPYLILSFSIFLILTLKWGVIIESLGYKVPFRKLVLYKACGFAAAYLTPSAVIGGEGIRAYFLKTHGMSFKKGLATNMIDKSVEFTLNVLFTIIGTIFLILYLSLPRHTIHAIVIGLIIAVAIIALFYFQLMRSRAFFSIIIKPWKHINYDFFSKLEGNFKKIEDIISDFLKTKRKAFAKSLGLSLIAWILMFFEYKVLLLTFGYNAHFSILFLVIAAMGLAYIFPIPAALGVLEGGQASVFKFSNMKISDAIALSIVVRMKDMIISLVGLFYLFNYGVSLKNK